MKNKTNKLEQRRKGTEDALYDFTMWLYNSNRLTVEEWSKLEDMIDQYENVTIESVRAEKN